MAHHTSLISALLIMAAALTACGQPAQTPSPHPPAEDQGAAPTTPQDQQPDLPPGADDMDTQEDLTQALDQGADQAQDQPQDTEKPIVTEHDLPCETPPWSAQAQRAPEAQHWGNLQHPPRQRIPQEQPSEPLYGQLWIPGMTGQHPGGAPGWRAELLVGPLGTSPYQPGACWRRHPTDFNLHVGPNDEHWARVNFPYPGLYGAMMRYSQPQSPDGPAILAGVNGPITALDNAPNQVSLIEVTAAHAPDQLTVVTLNLRCQVDQWPKRLDLIVNALGALNPDVIALQEDCARVGDQPQSTQLQAALAAKLQRGYTLRHHTTHQAAYSGITFDEGISILSAWPIDHAEVIPLPHANFPRAALVADLNIAGEPLRVISTHWDYGANGASARQGSAAKLLAQTIGKRAIIMGDLNATPDRVEIVTLSDALNDAWAATQATPGHTYPADNPMRRIDYIFTEGLGDPLQTSLINARLGALWLSDHLGLSAQIAWSR